MIVENALRQFSQDRTGLADYALESGGQNQTVPVCVHLYDVMTCVVTVLKDQSISEFSYHVQTNNMSPSHFLSHFLSIGSY